MEVADNARALALSKDTDRSACMYSKQTARVRRIVSVINRLAAGRMQTHEARSPSLNHGWKEMAESDEDEDGRRRAWKWEERVGPSPYITIWKGIVGVDGIKTCKRFTRDAIFPSKDVDADPECTVYIAYIQKINIH